MPIRIIRGSFLLLFPGNGSLLSAKSVAKSGIPLETASDVLQSAGYTRFNPANSLGLAGLRLASYDSIMAFVFSQ